jgi:hypothetical protein
VQCLCDRSEERELPVEQESGNGDGRQHRRQVGLGERGQPRRADATTRSTTLGRWKHIEHSAVNDESRAVAHGDLIEHRLDAVRMRVSASP